MTGYLGFLANVTLQELWATLLGALLLWLVDHVNMRRKRMRAEEERQEAEDEADALVDGVLDGGDVATFQEVQRAGANRGEKTTKRLNQRLSNAVERKEGAK